MRSALGDERLARLVSAGNDQAFAPIYERYHQQLYRYCRSIVHDDCDAQDALQSTFTGAFAALRRGQRDAPLRPWLFRIAHNEAVSILRRRRPESELSEAAHCCTASVEDQASERARMALLLADLRELPVRQRSALVMRELSGLSHEEIAIALGGSVGAAKQTIFEARKSLLEFSEGRGMACDEIRRLVSDDDGRTLRSRRVRAHLNECRGCAEFAAAITTRGDQLRALAPALPPVSAAAVLAKALGTGSANAGGAAGVAAGAGTAGKTMSAAFAAKAAAGVAIVAATTVGATAGLNQITSSAHHPARARVAPAHIAAPAATTAKSSAHRTHGAARDAGARTSPANAPAAGGVSRKRSAASSHRSVTRLGSTEASHASTSTLVGLPGSATSAADAPAPNQTVSPAPSTGSSQGAQTQAGGTTNQGGSTSATASPPQHRASGTGSTVTGAAPVISTPPAPAGVTIQLPATSTPTVQIPPAPGAPSVTIPGDGSGPTISIAGAPPVHVPGVGSLLSLLGGDKQHR
ncbi:MAG TPA: sigma-70 family RNA polymerase sigma factor [Solirubrobacteraceae bacterium]